VAVRSAGLLVWRRDAAEPGTPVLVLLAHPGGPLFARKDDGVWSVPKGEYPPEEEPLAAARREFAEEVGVSAPAGNVRPLGEAIGRAGKVNIVWAVEVADAAGLPDGPVTSNLFPMVWPPRSGRIQQFPEVDRVAWFDLETARRKVFSGQLPFLERLAELAAGGAA